MAPKGYNFIYKCKHAVKFQRYERWRRKTREDEENKGET